MCLVLDETEPRLFAVRFHPLYSDAVRDFLVSTCDPVTRPATVNEFLMTSSSLAAASSEGRWDPFDITLELIRLSGRRLDTPARDARNGLETPPLPPSKRFAAALLCLPRVFRDVLREMATSAKLSLVLHRRLGVAHPSANPARRLQKDHRTEGAKPAAAKPGSGSAHYQMAYYLVARSRDFLETLIGHDTVIASCLCFPGGDQAAGLEPAQAQKNAGATNGNGVHTAEPPVLASQHLRSIVFSDRETATGCIVFKAEVRGGHLRQLRRQVQATRGFHIDVQYDFKSDPTTPDVPGFRLRDTTKLRVYQEASLERFLRGGNARNGVVVLPCGAGKTLTGVAAAAAVGKPTIVMCINELSVRQWKAQFSLWAALSKRQVTVFTGKNKQMPTDVFITTYSMMTTEAVQQEDGSYSETQTLKLKILKEVEERPWGLLLLDEVHGAPAADFQRVLDRIKYHCVLGLTATLLREDGNIGSLRHLVGPKLYEANWLELAAAGHLATAHCAEVRCPTPGPYVTAYLGTRPMSSLRSDIEALNPTKLWCTQALVHYHTRVKSPADKVIIFCDSTYGVRSYAHALGVPYMEGRTKATERHNLLSHFRLNPLVNCVILSRVGDTALDIPEATVIIQVSGLMGSRRQEAQRLGRILRPKPASMRNTTAIFYSLVSTDTDEVGYSFGRQQWLRDQGFAYRVIEASGIIAAAGLGATPLTCVGFPVWQFRAPWRDSTAGSSRAVESAAPTHRGHRAETRDAASAGPTEVFESFPVCDALTLEKAFVAGQPTVTLPGFGVVVFDCLNLPATNGALTVPTRDLLSAEEIAEAQEKGRAVGAKDRGRQPQQAAPSAGATTAATPAADPAAVVITKPGKADTTIRATTFMDRVRAHCAVTGFTAMSGAAAASSSTGDEDGALTGFRLRVRRGWPGHRCDVENPHSPCVLHHLNQFTGRVAGRGAGVAAGH
jgi:DNA repair helicase Rad25